MRHLLPHYANKYGLENVECSGDKLRAYRNGKLALSLCINGAGALHDEGAELGLEDRHDLSPIPKASRLYKHDSKGHLVEDQEASARKEERKKFMREGKVLSCEELSALGWKFDSNQKVIEAPKA